MKWMSQYPTRDILAACRNPVNGFHFHSRIRNNYPFLCGPIPVDRSGRLDVVQRLMWFNGPSLYFFPYIPKKHQNRSIFNIPFSPAFAVAPCGSGRAARRPLSTKQKWNYVFLFLYCCWPIFHILAYNGGDQLRWKRGSPIAYSCSLLWVFACTFWACRMGEGSIVRASTDQSSTCLEEHMKLEK